ncbi:aspartic endopeptidase [Aureococcus anophagefferens]|nr:aspartic endopeptidase [Aureococcus anophagefferens]
MAPQLKSLLLAACVVAGAHGFVVAPRAALLPARRTAGKTADAGRTANNIILRAAPEELENPVAKDAPAYALAVAAQAIPLVTTDKLSHYVFFLAERDDGLPGQPRAVARAARGAAHVQAGRARARRRRRQPHGPLLRHHRAEDRPVAGLPLAHAFASLASFIVFYDGFDALVSADAANAAAAAATVILAAVYLGGSLVGLDDLVVKVGAANFLGWSLALFAARTVPLRSFAVGAALLGGLFFYDIFFVFASDIMVTVATKIDAPVKLVAPNAPGSANPFALLGLGDVALPSLMVAFLGRYGDAREAAAPRGGRPALLYLVPAVVGSGVLSAGSGEELRALLDYAEPRAAAEGSSSAAVIGRYVVAAHDWWDFAAVLRFGVLKSRPGDGGAWRMATRDGAGSDA